MISERVKTDSRNDKIFMPMNVEGGMYDEKFMTSGKVALLMVMIGSLVLIIAWGRDTGFTVQGMAIMIGAWVLIAQYLTRIFIFEENYYYKMYKRMKELDRPTPSVFWDIASMRDTEDGTVMIFSDLKAGVLIRLDRDTIIGKDEGFREEHYDAESDFYKEINIRGLEFVRENIMETAGKDPRLKGMDELAEKPDNDNLASLMRKQVGYIKLLTRATLFESDYIMLYTRNMNRIDELIGDASECVTKLLDGAYIGYHILERREILELVKELYGVQFFDYTNATLEMFKQYGMDLKPSFKLDQINLEKGDSIAVEKREEFILKKMLSEYIAGTLDQQDWTIRMMLSKDSDILQKSKAGGKVEWRVNINKLTEESERREREASLPEFEISDFDREVFEDDSTYEEELERAKIRKPAKKKKAPEKAPEKSVKASKKSKKAAEKEDKAAENQQDTVEFSDSDWDDF